MHPDIGRIEALDLQTLDFRASRIQFPPSFLYAVFNVNRQFDGSPCVK
jgi:hypothetical protein